MSLQDAASLVEALGVGSALTHRIGSLEAEALGGSPSEITRLLDENGLGQGELQGARRLKSATTQINVVIHALGVLMSLPRILESDERVTSLSLGAGNTGKAHDLETDRRVAEFKFTTWSGTSDTIRQNNLFSDVFALASDATPRRKFLYVLGTEFPLKFLCGGRALTSVLSRSPKTRRDFLAAHGEGSYLTVADYWSALEGSVEIVDLREVLPIFA